MSITPAAATDTRANHVYYCLGLAIPIEVKPFEKISDIAVILVRVCLAKRGHKSGVGLGLRISLNNHFKLISYWVAIRLIGYRGIVDNYFIFTRDR